METEITSMSSRGQIVIPQHIREELNLKEGEKFVVAGEKGVIFLKKIEMPNKRELIDSLNKIARKGREKAEKLGIKESDVPKILHQLRGIRK